MQKLKLEFQYFEDCPNHKKMSDNLFEAIKGLEDKIELIKVLVEDEEDVDGLQILSEENSTIIGDKK